MEGKHEKTISGIGVNIVYGLFQHKYDSFCEGRTGTGSILAFQ
ncbi:MAG: hypothetical protein RHS_4334 [Robinsoniella sp. RHS]|nr:MAG: hypothetical protein RHS_4334 [Robinsoniella sp. RHS]